MVVAGSGFTKVTGQCYPIPLLQAAYVGLRPPRRRRKGPIECVRCLGKDVMRLFALALTLSLADFAVASAQTATPNSENGRYRFNPIADGVCCD